MFARLSGDYNPLHVDPVAARRTLFGEPVVHGVHGLLWALEVAFSDIPAALTLVEIKATFHRAMGLDRILVVRAAPTSDDCVQLSVDDNGLKAISAVITYRPSAALPAEVGDQAFPTEARLRSFDDAATARGTLPLGLNHALAERLFPALHARMGSGQLAELLGTTRLVGMVCPGLHSIFGGLHLRIRDAVATRPSTDWSTIHAREPYSWLTLRIEGPSLAGKLDTFYRPPPRAPMSFSVVADRVQPASCSNWRAIVVGGSRGLGEAIAKAIAGGGGEVCVTWNRGEAEARAIVDEIVARGGRASHMHLDATAAADIRLPFVPTHVFYLATPFIRIDKAIGFDHELFELLTLFYVHGLDRVVRAVHRQAGPFALFAPSTELLNTREPGSSAYCAAKAAMEEYLVHLQRELKIPFAAPRLRRIATDQTSTLMQSAASDPVDVALEILRTPFSGADSR